MQHNFTVPAPLPDTICPPSGTDSPSDNKLTLDDIRDIRNCAKYLSARSDGLTPREAAKLVGVSRQTAYQWEKLDPVAFFSAIAKARGGAGKDGVKILLTDAAVSAPVQYKAALFRLLSDIEGWTKPQAEEAGDKAAERLKAWLDGIAKAATAQVVPRGTSDPAPAPLPPPDNPADDSLTH